MNSSSSRFVQVSGLGVDHATYNYLERRTPKVRSRRPISMP